MVGYPTLYWRHKNFKCLLKLFITISLLFLWSLPISPINAPSTIQAQNQFVYTVQPGDTLILLALRYNLNLAEIALVNDLSNLTLIFPGQQLILPGVTPPTPTSTPVPVVTPSPQPEQLHLVQTGETIYSIANFYGVSVDSLITLNNLQDSNQIQAGQSLQIPLAPPSSTLRASDSLFKTVTLSEASIIQGRTLVLQVTLSEAATLSGTFEGLPLFFHNSGLNQFWALIPIHALLQPATYPITLFATLPDGKEITQFEEVTVIAGPYGTENIQLDATRNALLDADLLAVERETLINVWSQVTLQPRWTGPFWYPVAGNQPRFTSYFGTRRTYNNSQQLSFHSGVDFGGGTGTPIYAPAAGRVLLAEPLTVRGNVVLIDHGLGLYSGFWHQDRIAVTVGQELQPGDLIGYIGNTGLATGPHLHWEMRLNGVAVDPLQWLNNVTP